MRLWLDDKRPMPPGFDIHVYTAKDAITLLETGLIDKISLDHDLGERDTTGDGYEVACWIEQAAFHRKIPKLEWNVHSQNGVGVTNMCRALTNADRYWNGFGR